MRPKDFKKATMQQLKVIAINEDCENIYKAVAEYELEQAIGKLVLSIKRIF